MGRHDLAHQRVRQCSADSKAPRVYSIVVCVDGVCVPDSSHSVLYRWARSPTIETVALLWSLPGSLLDLHGSFHNSKHCKLDHTDLVSSEAKSGNVFTKAFVGGVPCDIVDDNLELCDTLTREKVTCRSKAKLVGPMNVTVCVTGRGASEVTKIGRYLDSQDRLYQFLTYAVVWRCVLPQGIMASY
ncbi:fibrocystin-L-like isoform X2 [Scylla paramamosain]|uniref:fibrocystin-L-like isoform X2 n=1 Tax=Scylla paramamosain TaxID=85552 RepID=UPI003082F6FA